LVSYLFTAKKRESGDVNLFYPEIVFQKGRIGIRGLNIIWIIVIIKVEKWGR